jgi:hypothetical protein
MFAVMTCRPRRLIRGLLSSLFLALVAMQASCSLTPVPPSVIALPNGYYVQRDKTARPTIVKATGRTVLTGPVAAYAVHQNIVAGCVGLWPSRSFGYPNETPWPESVKADYFVLDTRTGQLDSKLDRAAWLERLQTLGVPRSFTIKAPILPEEERRTTVS